MKKIRMMLWLLFIPVLLKAQTENPVRWSFSKKKLNPHTYELYIKARIDTGWHLYAQQAGTGKVQSTSLRFLPNPLVIMNGKPRETGSIQEAYDKIAAATLRFYEREVTFIQTVTVTSKATTRVKGTVEYMVCNDRLCLPPKELPFEIVVGGN